MRILVTGSAGYIGSHVFRLATDLGHSVFGIDNFSNPHSAGEACPVGVDSAYDFVKFHRPDALIHLAAHTRPDESFVQPDKYLGENVSNTRLIAEYAAEFGINRVVFASSANVYMPLDDPLQEDGPLCPNSPYGESKLIGERILDWYARIHGFTAVSLRFFNVVGGGHISGHHLIPSILSSKREGRAFTIYGGDYNTVDGTCIRDFIHVHDVARAILHATTIPSGAYNVGTGVGASVLDIVLKMGCAFDFGDKRTGDPAVLVACPCKLIATGWSPTYGLDEIINNL